MTTNAYYLIPPPKMVIYYLFAPENIWNIPKGKDRLPTLIYLRLDAKDLRAKDR